MTTTASSSAYRESLKANRVFILGAGFSAAAGVPLTNELLKEALNLFSIECPGIYSRVENYAMESIGQESGSLNVERLNFSEL